jgi:hypothetical protein
MRRAYTVLVLVAGLAATPAAAGTYVTGPLPSEFGPALIPPDSNRLRNIQTAAKAVTKLRLAVEKCYERGVTNFAAGRPTGLAACLGDPVKGALAKYADTIATLEAKPGSLPHCAALAQKGPGVAELTRALHAWAFCGDPPDLGSPGGAFVDGAHSS